MGFLKAREAFGWDDQAKRRAVILNLPFLGRVALVRDRWGSANRFPGGMEFYSNLTATLRRNGKIEGSIDLGSGAVTNVGCMALANDFAWAQNAQTLKLANNHATGTGTNAAAATDITLQTAASPTATTAVAGTQSLVSTANNQTYQSAGTLTYTGPTAVTEWALFTDTALSVTTGTPATAATATSLTATGTPYTASSATVQGQQQHIVVPGTTTVYGLILSNTTSVLTVPAWYKVADGTAGSTPGATEAFTIKPVMWDRKQFSVLNFINLDQVTWTYKLQCVSGG